MIEEDFDDPAVEDAWCKEQYFAVAEYLKEQALDLGRIDPEPSFFVAPYVSLWGVCSSSNPGVLAWWVIIGDLPTDYISAETIKDPQAALLAIGQRWLEAAGCMEQGKTPLNMQIGTPESWSELAPMLESRAQTIIDWARDGEVWENSL